MNDRGWTAADFDYVLPQDLIAQTPPPERGASRLLIVKSAGDGTAGEKPQFVDATFTALVDLIEPNDLVVLNTTRVRHARFFGTRPSGAPAEVLLIHPASDDSWVAMGSPGRAMQPGKRIQLDATVAIETIEILEDGMRRIRFVGASAAEAVARFGTLPLPPYIDRAPTADDESRYQTVFAEREGSVAAPTAGLHFTVAMLEQLRRRGVQVGRLDLEVGPGTFRPMDDGPVIDHPMHSERYEIPAALAEQVRVCRSSGAKVWAVGTTVVRALESAAHDGDLVPGPADTQLMISPGFTFKVVDRLITNFHLPRSTLLLLVAAFAGYDTAMAAYRHAVEQRYRFYSYGDAMVIVR